MAQAADGVNLWQRFVRWLARREMDELRLKFGALGVQHGLQTEFEKRQAYAEGQMAGYQAAWDEIAKMIAERTGGAADYVTTDDLERAKKGILH